MLRQAPTLISHYLILNFRFSLSFLQCCCILAGKMAPEEEVSGISMLSRSHERSQNFNQEKAPYSRLYVRTYHRTAAVAAAAVAAVAAAVAVAPRVQHGSDKAAA